MSIKKKMSFPSSNRLRHLHLHVIEMYNDSDWGGVVAMMMERKDILGGKK